MPDAMVAVKVAELLRLSLFACAVMVSVPLIDICALC
jgi:hypothetical protein